MICSRNKKIAVSSGAVLTGSIALGIATLSFNAYRGWWSLPAIYSVVAPPTTAPLTSNNNASDPIRFLEDRVKQDPDDFVTYNKLAAYYLQNLRETGNIAYLDLTYRAAHASLVAVPMEQNIGDRASRICSAQLRRRA